MKKPTNNKQTEAIKIDAYLVERAKVDAKGNVRFNLTLNGVTINGCRVQEGNDHDFISFPSYKGSDGKFYNIVYVRLSDEDQAAILKTVEDMIN